MSRVECIYYALDMGPIAILPHWNTTYPLSSSAQLCHIKISLNWTSYKFRADYSSGALSSLGLLLLIAWKKYYKIGLLICQSHIELRLWLRLSWGWGWGWSWVEVDLNLDLIWGQGLVRKVRLRLRLKMSWGWLEPGSYLRLRLSLG